MGRKLKNTGHKLLHSNGLIYTFLRSGLTSQTSGWVDMIVSFVLFAWAGLTPWLSSAIGAVAGGVVNCVLNYRFTFHADGCPWSAVVVKYLMVWTGSFLLNTFGTQIAYYAMRDWQWLADMGFTADGCYAAARLGVSLLVSWFWNFVLQRHFVYRPTRFDRYAVEFYAALRRKVLPHKAPSATPANNENIENIDSADNIDNIENNEYPAYGQQRNP